MWTVDFKGWWYNGLERCEPLTVRDEYSRYLLELRALDNARGPERCSRVLNDSLPMRSPPFRPGSPASCRSGTIAKSRPDRSAVDRAIDILIIAVVGGVTRPIGPFIGALIFVLLRTFALDFLVAIGLDGNRFRLLIGLGFLVIVFFSPDGVVGLWERWRRRGEPTRAAQGGGHGHG